MVRHGTATARSTGYWGGGVGWVACGAVGSLAAMLRLGAWLWHWGGERCAWDPLPPSKPGGAEGLLGHVAMHGGGMACEAAGKPSDSQP